LWAAECALLCPLRAGDRTEANEIRRPKSEGRRKPEIRRRNSGVEGRRSRVEGRGSEVRGRRSEVRGQGFHIPVFNIEYPVFSMYLLSSRLVLFRVRVDEQADAGDAAVCAAAVGLLAAWEKCGVRSAECGVRRDATELASSPRP